MASTDKMDRGLDEIIADNRGNGSRNRRNGGGRRRDRQEGPRDGVRKSYRDEPRDLDGEWVHDRYEENSSRRGPRRQRREPPVESDSKGTKIRVDNIHYDLTENDLDELFTRIGPITKLDLRYDRAGRSEGTAFVVYESRRDALEAVKQFDGANANGQPIRLVMMAERSNRNPFDNAVMPGKPLSERISAPGGRSRSESPPRYTREEATRKGIDRYIPGEGRRSVSPGPRRRGGRRPGGRRDGGGRDQERGGRGNAKAANPRSKKTQEELDAEMADYFGGSGDGPDNAKDGNAASSGAVGNGQAVEAAPQPAGEDIDMIE